MALALAEQVLAAFQAALLNQVSGIDARVERDREDVYTDDEFTDPQGAVKIKPDSESSRVLGGTVDDNELKVDVEIYVRAKQGDVWTTKANAFAVLIHARLMTYMSWPAGVARIRKTGADYAGDEPGRTPGRLTLSYAVRYLTHANALDATPNQP